MSRVKIKRHAAKAISYRLLATLATVTMVYIVTGWVKIAAGYAVVEFIVKVLIYFGHERFWYKYIKYGVIKNGKSNSNRG